MVVRSGFITLLMLTTSSAEASDLARTLSFIQSSMGDEAIDGMEEFLDDDPTEALPVLLARRIEPGEAPGYTPASMRMHNRVAETGLGLWSQPAGGARIVSSAEYQAPAAPHFQTLGNRRLNYGVLRPFILEAAQATGLPAGLIDAVIRTESGYRTRAVSRAGAMGLMQLMPATAESLGVSDAFDPRQNILGGATYLRKMYDRFGSVRLAVAAYNAGPGAVAKHDGVPPYSETQRYVRTVIRRYQSSPIQ